MQKYEYEYDTITNLTTRIVGEVFPEYEEVIPNGKLIKMPVGHILKELKRALMGVSETKAILTEDSWWIEQDEQQQLSSLVLTIPELTATTKIGIDGTTVDLTTEELSVIEQELNLLLSEYNQIDSDSLIIELNNRIDSAILRRNAIEDISQGQLNNSWLKTYRGLTVTEQRPVVTVPVPKSDIKDLIAYERDSSVRNTEDTLADLAKMNSLLFSMVVGIYGALSVAAKNKIPPEERALIDYATTKFLTMQTRADRQLASEGTALIDKLLDREQQIADLVDNFFK